MTDIERRSSAQATTKLTHVELTWIEKKIERWIRFGHLAESQIIDRQRRIASFAPGSIFAFVRWASNDFGTIVSRVDVLRATAQGEPYTTVPFVRPGAEILLRIHGWPKVRTRLAIDRHRRSDRRRSCRRRP